MLKKSDVRRIVNRTFDNTKTVGVKKIFLGGAHRFSGLSKQNNLGITNNEAKYQKSNATFMNKAVPRPVRAKNIFSQLQSDLVDMMNQLIGSKNKSTNTSFQSLAFLVDVIS